MNIFRWLCTFLVAFWAFSLINAGTFEDAKDIVSSFKSVVDSPLSKDIKKVNVFVGNGMLFMRRIVPFAEFMALALKIKLEEDKLDSLLEMTNGINAQLVDVRKQLAYISKSTSYTTLLMDYRREVVKPLDILLDQIDAMSKLRMNVSESTVTTFTADFSTYHRKIYVRSGSNLFTNTLRLHFGKPIVKICPKVLLSEL